ncbi:hypothetical protein A0H76_1378 [Hepatospora eriocheir]|uniref:Uncharacterized protein n=1 Tax=Hepatospora eriocheir TaxID=1081669 RepID=A0A1X0QH75_9MICR|nr:hypothetical protein A0H76_1378 [Hepatospora eriocheir]
MMLTNVSGVVNEIAMVEDNTIKEVLKISSLHGLEIKEWSFIVKESIKSLYKELLYEQALEIVIKSLKTKLLEEKFFIGLLVIKIAIKSRSLSELIILIRYFCKTYNYTFYYFYCYLLRHINRYENSSEYTQFNRMIQRKMLKDNNPDTLPLLIYTYLPRFNFVNTITDLADNFQTDNFNINLIIGALLIGHSRSRRAKFPKKLVQRGFKRLNDLTENTQEEIDYKNYNMGKAFHYLGLISKAECFYFKVLDSENVCLKRMAIYNLSLLWKNNKSNALIRHILNKY